MKKIGKYDIIGSIRGGIVIKIVTRDAIYLQKEDLAYFNQIFDRYFKAETKPVFMKMSTLQDSTLNEENRYDFIEFRKKEEMEYIKKIDWIIDYEDVKSKNIQEINDLSQNILRQRENVANTYNAMSVKKRGENQDMPLKCDLYNYVLQSLANIIYFKRGDIIMNLPKNIHYPKEVRQIRLINIRNQSIRILCFIQKKIYPLLGIEKRKKTFSRKKDTFIKKIFGEKRELYRFLGAEEFQKAVFFLERIKYKIMDKFFPNVQIKYEKRLNKQFKKRIQEEPLVNQQALLQEYQNQKLAFRKEMVYKENRNYHYNPNYPTNFLKYLDWNKKVHIEGIKKDILFLIGGSTLTLALGNPAPLFSFLFCLIQCISLMIDFECVNLQNYNLDRFQNERTKSLLKKKEEKNIKNNLQKLGDSIVPVSKAVTEKVELPSIEEVIDQITTAEQAKCLLAYVKEQYANLEQHKEKSIYEKKRRI